MRGLRQRLADANARGCNRRGKREGKALANADIGGYDEGGKMLATMVEGTGCCHDLGGATTEEEEEREILRKTPLAPFTIGEEDATLSFTDELENTTVVDHWRGRHQCD